jgi:outer membrane protein insertion porin family
MSQASTIFVLGFAEAGNNFHTLQDFDPFDNYRSIGFGARIFMPAFGLLGIDWGYGFDTIPDRNQIQNQVAGSSTSLLVNNSGNI